MKGVEWMLDQVKTAAGIHFSSFKSKDKGPKEDPELDEAEMDISGWTPPPHMMAKWAKAV